MKFVIVLLMLGLCQGHVLRAQWPRATKASRTKIDNQLIYSLEYRARFATPVAWIGNSDQAISGATSSFDVTTGEGVSTISVRADSRDGVKARLFSPSDEIVWTYDLQIMHTRIEQDFDFDLPEIDLWSPAGKNWTYTSGVPFQASVHYSRLPTYSEPYLGWTFIGTDPARQPSRLELVTDTDPSVGSHVSNVSTGRTEFYHEASAELNLVSYQGLVVIELYYTSQNSPRISVQRVFNIFEREQAGPFPPNFIGLYTSEGFRRVRRVFCTLGEPCWVTCVAVGSNVTSMELRKSGSEHKFSTANIRSMPSFYMKTFSVTLESPDDFGNYTCLASNDNGSSAETIILVSQFDWEQFAYYMLVDDPEISD